MTRPRQIGLPWYRPEQYAQLRALMADGERLPALYDVWRLSAEQITGEIERSGVKAVRVEIEPEPFGRWCAQHGLRATASELHFGHFSKKSNDFNYLAK